MKATQLRKQLADTTLELLSQNKLLEDLRNDLLRIAARIPANEPAARELRRRVGSLRQHSIDWKKYDRQFREIFPAFLDALSERAPEITPTEIRICTMVRLRLKSRQIASLLGISQSAVTSRRRSIRRKLGLKRHEQLSAALGAM